MSEERKIEVSMSAMEELEVLLRKLEMADMDGLQTLLEAGLREAAGVFADVLESALEEAREC